MDEALVTQWNEVVAPGDEVWILGDLAMRPHDESLPKVTRLNGYKILVPGNHDECWEGQRDKQPGEVVGPKERRMRIARQMQYRWAAGIAEIIDDPEPHRMMWRCRISRTQPTTPTRLGTPRCRTQNTARQALTIHLQRAFRRESGAVPYGEVEENDVDDSFIGKSKALLSRNSGEGVESDAWRTARHTYLSCLEVYESVDTHDAHAQFCVHRAQHAFREMA